MIVGDLTIWSTALRGHDRGFESLFNALFARGDLTAPGVVFAQLIADTNEPMDAVRLRQWGQSAPAVDEPMAAWTAVGDLHHHLATQGCPISLVDAATVVLCLREDWALWSFNPALEPLPRLLPALKRYQPSGL